MLTGRESLIRLVGKRRRYLPNRQAIEGLILDDKEGGVEECKRSLDDVASSDGVNCPVCGSRVPGGDYMMNSHLDTCLSRGTKRKMTQRTLLQYNFSSQLPVDLANEADKLIQNVDSEDYCDGAQNDSGLIDKRERGLFELGLNDEIEVVVEHINHDRTKKLIIDSGDELNSLRNKVYKDYLDLKLSGIVGVALETLIVGRKFSTEKELDIGAKISLLRDPNNPKDSNAIQVILDGCGCCRILGFLPKELARYISPLIEKYAVTFEGRVISVPKLANDAVPIEITCREVLLGHEDQNEIEVFTSLWNNALHVVKSTKTAKYQQNFCLFIEEVLRSNTHLFTVDEKHLLESFTSLSDDSQRLFVRLYARKGPWFRISNISYPEVLDLQQAIKGLSELGYIYSFENANELLDDELKEILNLLNVSELRDFTCMLKKNGIRGARKRDFVALLFSSFQDGVCPFLSTGILDKTGTCIKITSKVESLIWRAERLFFLNGEQDLSAFLLVDLGIFKYPAYKCITSEHIFSSRSNLLAYEEAIELAQIIDESLDDNNTKSLLKCIMIAESRMSASSAAGSQSMATFRYRFSAPWIYSKVVSLGVSFLEREQRYNDAVNLLKKLLNSFLCDGRRGHWTVRLSIDLEHIGYVNESLSVAEVGLQDPWVRAGARMALQRRVVRLAKPPRRWKIPSFSDLVKKKIKEVHIQGRPLNREIGTKSRFYGEDGEQCGVEQLALQYYAEEGGGWQGVHTESGIWLTIFGLLMWDIMFADVPNVFRNKFQTAPLDIDTDSFYITRKNLIETHLEKIYDGMGEEILITSWELHSGISCRGVNWDRHSLSELRAAVTCIGGPCLTSLCRHLAQDYRSWSSGMPDLLLWRFSGDYRGEAKLVEVKGPRDRLSEQQRAWLLLLMDCGFDTEVCKVSPTPIAT